MAPQPRGSCPATTACWPTTIDRLAGQAALAIFSNNGSGVEGHAADTVPVLACVDDRQGNVDSARAAGLDVMRFESAQTLRDAWIARIQPGR